MEGERATDLSDMISKFRKGELNGENLSKMVAAGTLSKSERRFIAKKASKPEPTPRQLLRQEVKAKKALPRGKLSKDQRRDKFSSVDEKEQARLKDEANFTICLGCRKRGHFLKDCPKATVAASAVAAVVDGICFNCGESDHTLKDCKKPRDRHGKLPFASCFICKRKGHIARDCDQNANGLYPQGGCCHICLQKTHLAKDCPERTEELKEEWARKREAQRQADEDKLLGPRVKGLVDGAGGDDMEFEGGSEDEGDDQDSGGTSKKRKGEKREKKRGKKTKRSVEE